MKIWKSKIVSEGEEDPRSLLANERNWRVHPGFQRKVVREGLEEIGWIQRVIVNKRSSEEWGKDRDVETMVDGHLRVELALRHDQDSIPVTYVDLSPDEERLALLTLDPSASLAEQDEEILGELLKEAAELDLGDGLDDLMNKLARDAKLYELIDGGETEEGFEEEIASEFIVMIECEDEFQQNELLERLIDEGLKVRAIVNG